MAAPWPTFACPPATAMMKLLGLLALAQLLLLALMYLKLSALEERVEVAAQGPVAAEPAEFRMRFQQLLQRAAARRQAEERLWRARAAAARAAVAAAGIWVEMLLASACLLLWWFSEPGAFHLLCMNVMLIGSLNTVLLNGNPLLRYDGYFVLSDLAELPNLAQRSRQRWVETARHWLLGVEPAPDRSMCRWCRARKCR